MNTEIAEALSALAPDLTGHDKMRIGVATHRSLDTIDRYLAGAVPDPLTGKAILDAARKIVAEKAAQNAV